MAAPQVEPPDPHTLGDSWGLGWVRFDWNGHRLIGHDGSTIGQSAFLRILPDQGLAVTLLTNGGNATKLFETLFREIFAEYADVPMPPPLTPPPDPPTVDIGGYLGTYERAGERLDVFERNGTPHLRRTLTGPLASHSPDPGQELELVPVTETVFVVREPSTNTWSPVTFYALPSGESYIHHVIRATPKAR